VRAALKDSGIGKDAWRATKQRIIAQCHDLILGDLRKDSFTGFDCVCADGQTRKVFPAIHSYIADTPEHHKLAGVMNWPAACYCCNMPRTGERPLDDLVRPDKWSLRTVKEMEELQKQADAIAAAATAAEIAAAAAARPPREPEAAAGLRAAVKFCEQKGIVWGAVLLR